MITEKGSIKVAAAMTSAVQKSLNRTLFIISLVALIVGALGLAAYFALTVYFGVAAELTGNSAYESLADGFNPMLIFAVPFGFGLVFVIVIRVQIKNAAKQSDCKNEYEFFAGHLILNEYKSGIQVGKSKIFYKNIVKYKETQDYLFFYLVRTLAYFIPKADLTEEENATIRKAFNLPHDAAKVLSLPQNPEDNPFNEA